MRLGWVTLWLAACGHAAVSSPGPASGTAAAPGGAAGAGEGVGICAPAGYDRLGITAHSESDGPQLVTKMDSAQSAAFADVDAAEAADQAGKPHDAALRYLDCAHRFRDVPDGDPFASSAIGDAHICYTNAITAFANAGMFASEGKAVLEREAAADPRNAEYIKAEIAKAPYECPPSAR